jgi:hypothetical protein
VKIQLLFLSTAALSDILTNNHFQEVISNFTALRVVEEAKEFLKERADWPT